MVYSGIHFFLLFLLKNINVGTGLNHLAEAVLTCTHNLCCEQKYEKYQNFLSKTFQFFKVKFSIYLNKRIFVMRTYSNALS